jgi:hypothetical protein
MVIENQPANLTWLSYLLSPASSFTITSLTEPGVQTIMRQAIIKEDLSTSFETDAAIPEPREDEVIIRAVYAGVNPIDWKGAREADAVALHGELKNLVHRAAGKDFAGYVHAVG